MDRKITYDEQFTGCRSNHAPVAQTVEHSLEKAGVVSSNLTRSTKPFTLHAHDHLLNSKIDPIIGSVIGLHKTIPFKYESEIEKESITKPVEDRQIKG